MRGHSPEGIPVPPGAWSSLLLRWDQEGVGDDRFALPDDERVDVERLDSVPGGEPDGVEPHDRFRDNIEPNGRAAARAAARPIASRPKVVIALLTLTDAAGSRAIRLARAVAVVISWSGGTTSFTMPMRSASAASK
jgi:hypothetical protein